MSEPPVCPPPLPDSPLWPEQPAPPGVACADFGLQGHGRLVWGEGNPAARLMVVLDNPGAKETPAGAPYTCGTRLTLTRAAAEAGLVLGDLYVTYLVKCRPRRAYDRERAQAAGRRHLSGQVETQRPAALILLGDVVAKALTGQAVRALRGAVLTVLGTPAVAGYHPLAARRRPNLYPLLVADFRRAGELV